MDSARLPSAAVGNGRLLVTLDHQGDVLSACWPCIDSPNQLQAFRVSKTPSDKSFVVSDLSKSQFDYVRDTNIFSARTADCLLVQDLVIDVTIPTREEPVDVHVRCVAGPHPILTLYFIPELDGRPGAQTVYWDDERQVLLAFCRQCWVAIGSARGRVYDFHCGRRGDESSAVTLLSDPSLPGERLAFRNVDAALRVTESAEATILYSVYGQTREVVLDGIRAARMQTWSEIEKTAQLTAQGSLDEVTLSGSTASVNQALRRSSLVFDLLTNRVTGGVIAGPDVQSGIASAPGYATVWARDAAWTALGALAMGRAAMVKQMLRFTLVTQAPEGLWLHRHHTDYALASSWGLHQIDETGIVLHAILCYSQSTGDIAFAKESWLSISKAANFLLQACDAERGLPIRSIDLWEEREGFHLYTAASVIAGLKAAALLAEQLNDKEQSAHNWWGGAEEIERETLLQFWNPEQNRFLSSLHSSSALPMVDPERPELSAKMHSRGSRPTTALAQYPNWRGSSVIVKNLAHDISVLALAVPFGVLPVDDPRIISTVSGLREHLWNAQVGGMARYEGDSYGGGNPWPLASLWLAIYEGACGNAEEAHRLIDWVVAHSTPAGLVPEQVHRESGKPVAAVPLTWSHAMLAIAIAATKGQHAWRPY